MKIPGDQKYWDLCAAICLINTILDYLPNNAGQISSLIGFEKALEDTKKFELKEDCIKKLWKNMKIKKNCIWYCLSWILCDCELWNIFFYQINKNDFTSSISYSWFISGFNAENKLAYVVEFQNGYDPEILLEKNNKKFLLISVFSPSAKTMYYFRKNSWFLLGNQEEKILSFRPGMYLLYIKIQDNSILEPINYAKNTLILDNKNYYGEHVIWYIDQFSIFLRQEIENCAYQKVESKEIERLTIENKALKELLDEASKSHSAEIEELKGEIFDLKKQLMDKDKAAEVVEMTNKDWKDEFDDLKKNYNLLLSRNEQLFSKHINSYKLIKQAYDEFSEIAIDNYFPDKELIIKNQSEQHDPSKYANSSQKDSENSIFLNRKLGIPNLGNTCYLNSVLQIFASTNKLYEIVNRKTDSLSMTLAKVLSMVRNGNTESISPPLRQLKSEIDTAFPEFINWDQQDAKELLAALLDFTLDASSKSLFSFSFTEIFPCSRCTKQSSITRKESLLIIPNSENNIVIFFEKIKNAKKIQGQGLKCDFCAKNSVYETKVINIEYPPYIILYLFDPGREHQRNSNILQETLELNNQIYYLYGVICYYACRNGGHYTTFTKLRGDWVEYNDKVVENKTFDQNAAYLAFYSVFF